MDKQSQKFGLKLLVLLNRASQGALPDTEQKVPADNDWKGFMLELAASDSLLTSLIYVIKTPTEPDNTLLCLRGIEGIYQGLLDVNPGRPNDKPDRTRITALVSRGLISAAMDQTFT